MPNIFGDDDIKIERNRKGMKTVGRGRKTKGGRRGGKGGNFKSLKRAIKVASKTPEAVVKIIGFGGSRASAKNMVEYVARNGDLELEHSNGSALLSDEARADLIDEWADNFSSRVNARNVMHLMNSTPEGTPPENLVALSREWAEENLAEYDYVMVQHYDTDNPHTHYIVSRREDGPRLDPKKNDCRKWRESWAEIGTKHGISMAASSRIERGNTRKSDTQSDIHIRDREGFTRNDIKAAAEVLSEYKSNPQERPWDAVLEARLKAERLKCETLSGTLSQLAKDAGDQAPLLQATAKLIARQSMSMRQVLTRRDIMRKLIEDDNFPSLKPSMKPEDLAKAYSVSEGYIKNMVSPAKDEVINTRLDEVGEAIGKSVIAETPTAKRFYKTLADQSDNEIAL